MRTRSSTAVEAFDGDRMSMIQSIVGSGPRRRGK
jgi:hypothetical protein